MNDYDFNNDERQKRRKGKQAVEAVTSLAARIAVLRTLLEEAMQKRQNRLAMDIIFALQKCVVEFEGLEIRAGILFLIARLHQLCSERSYIIKETLNGVNLP